MLKDLAPADIPDAIRVLANRVAKTVRGALPMFLYWSVLNECRELDFPTSIRDEGDYWVVVREIGGELATAGGETTHTEMYRVVKPRKHQDVVWNELHTEQFPFLAITEEQQEAIINELGKYIEFSHGAPSRNPALITLAPKSARRNTPAAAWNARVEDMEDVPFLKERERQIQEWSGKHLFDLDLYRREMNVRVGVVLFDTDDAIGCDYRFKVQSRDTGDVMIFTETEMEREILTVKGWLIQEVVEEQYGSEAVITDAGFKEIVNSDAVLRGGDIKIATREQLLHWEDEGSIEEYVKGISREEEMEVF